MDEGRKNMKETPIRYVHIFFIFFISATLAGCYTILNHPPAENSPDNPEMGHCTECHAYYPHPGPYDPHYPDPWWYYYDYPWWYEGVVIVDEEGEAPGRRLIHERDLQYREGYKDMYHAPFDTDSPSSLERREYRDGNEEGSGSSDDKTKSRDKRAKRREDRRRDVRRVIRKEDRRKERDDSGDRRGRDENSGESSGSSEKKRKKK